MSQADDILTAGKAVYNYLNAAKAELQIADLFYGDQDLYPNCPAVAVEPLTFDRVLRGIATGGITENTFNAYIIVYHGQMDDVQKSRTDTDEFAANIEKYLHRDLTLGGFFIHGFVEKVESGQAQRGQVLAVTRLTWQGLTKTLLGA